MPAPSQHGYLDLVMQSHIMGWAAADGEPAARSSGSMAT
jgi:hypothetical protein